MTHAPSDSADSVRSTRPWGSPAPTSFAEEDSRVQLRARLAPQAWPEEEPFPLVRERMDSIEQIDVIFDDVRFTRPTAPTVRQAVQQVAVQPLAPTSEDWRGIPPGTILEEPAPPSKAYLDDALASVAGRKRWTARAVLARILFGLCFCAIVALLVYEIRLFLQTGASPF